MTILKEPGYVEPMNYKQAKSASVPAYIRAIEIKDFRFAPVSDRSTYFSASYVNVPLMTRLETG